MSLLQVALTAFIVGSIAALLLPFPWSFVTSLVIGVILSAYWASQN